jgi:hypothetical protein
MRWRTVHRRASSRRQRRSPTFIRFVGYKDADPIGDFYNLLERQAAEAMRVPVAALTPGMESYGRALTHSKKESSCP